MVRHPVAFAVGLLLASVIGGHASAGVLVVGPGQAYKQVDTAAWAAADGDVVLVKAGTYPQKVSIFAKSVSVVAEVGALVNLSGGVDIENVPAGKLVTLDRLVIAGSEISSPQSKGLTVTNCAGAIRVQQCNISGAFGTATISFSTGCHVTGIADGANGVVLESSSDVSFVSCTLSGGHGAAIWDDKCFVFKDSIMIGGKGGMGLLLSGSSASVYDTKVFGGSSGTGGYSFPAGHAIDAKGGSHLVLVRVDALGGYGGDSNDDFKPAPGGPGGDGLDVEAGVDEVRYLDCTFQGGPEGSGWGYTGGDLAPNLSGSGLFIPWSGPSKTLGFAKLVREGQLNAFGLSGVAGETAMLFASFKSTSVLVSKAKGTFVLDPATLIGPFTLGVLASESLSVSVPMPDLPPGVDDAQLVLQGVLVGPSGMTLSSWGVLTVLDSSF